MVILRTPEEKADLDLAWARSDEEFFASGGCHVLTAAFLMAYPGAGFSGCRLWPGEGQRGSHVVAMRGDLVFDWAGYTERETFLADYVQTMRGLVPGWDARLLPITIDPISWEFCRATGSRHPSQFRHDPLARARAFLARFPPPPAGSPAQGSCQPSAVPPGGARESFPQTSHPTRRATPTDLCSFKMKGH